MVATLFWRTSSTAVIGLVELRTKIREAVQRRALWPFLVFGIGLPLGGGVVLGALGRLVAGL